MAIQAGRPTERVGHAVVSPGCIERQPFRDERGLIAVVVERRHEEGLTHGP
jgi:hypothetical protein